MMHVNRASIAFSTQPGPATSVRRSSRAIIAHIERQSRNPSLKTLARLAAALDVSLEALLNK